MDFSYYIGLFGQLSEGVTVSIKLFLLTILFALPLGLLVALGRMSKTKIVKEFFKLYILIVRGTPLMLQIFFIYFAPSKFLNEMFDIRFDRFIAAVIAFSLNYAGYFAEIYRGGIESIPSGQNEAAEILGLTKIQSFMRIVLPQVIKRILPPISNELITLVKDTALVQVIGISELFRVAQDETTRTFITTPLFIAGLFYLILNWILTKLLHTLEKKLSYYK